MTKTTKEANPYYFQDLATRYCDETFLQFGDMIYGACYWQGIVYLYNGNRYEVITDRDFNLGLRQYLIHKKIPQNNRVIGNVAPIVHTLIHKDMQRYRSMPFYMGEGPFGKPENIIAYNNGLLDLEAYLAGKPTLIEHTPLWVSTVCLPYDYLPDATCPQWEGFLANVFDGDKGQIDLLQEWFGYCLTHDTSLQKFMVWVGLERAGKGTTWDILHSLMGDDAATGFSLYQLGYQFGLYPLVGKLVAFAGEAELKGCSDRGRILETLKGIVGEDTLLIEQKHNPYPVSVVLPARLVIACNELPSFYETTGALASRLLLLKYNKSFAGREDYTLKQRLRSELSGINNWALKGLARLRANGRFTITEATEKAIGEFKRDNSPTIAFVQDCLIVESRLDPGNLAGLEISDRPIATTKGQIESAYREWCRLEGYDDPLSSPVLFRKLRSVVPLLEPKPNTRGDDKTYSGIGLKIPCQPNIRR